MHYLIQVFGLSMDPRDYSYSQALRQLGNGESAASSSMSHAEQVKAQLNAPSHVLPSPATLLQSLASSIITKQAEREVEYTVLVDKKIVSNTTSLDIFESHGEEKEDDTPSAAKSSVLSVVDSGSMFADSMTSFFKSEFNSPPGQASDEEKVGAKRKRSPSPVKGSSPPPKVSKVIKTPATKKKSTPLHSNKGKGIK